MKRNMTRDVLCKIRDTRQVMIKQIFERSHREVSGQVRFHEQTGGGELDVHASDCHMVAVFDALLNRCFPPVSDRELKQDWPVDATVSLEDTSWDQSKYTTVEHTLY